MAQPVADICTIVLTAVFAYYVHRSLNEKNKKELAG
jgi:hypothetical protein